MVNWHVYHHRRLGREGERRQHHHRQASAKERGGDRCRLSPAEHVLLRPQNTNHRLELDDHKHKPSRSRADEAVAGKRINAQPVRRVRVERPPAGHVVPESDRGADQKRSKEEVAKHGNCDPEDVRGGGTRGCRGHGAAVRPEGQDSRLGKTLERGLPLHALWLYPSSLELRRTRAARQAKQTARWPSRWRRRLRHCTGGWDAIRTRCAFYWFYENH